MGFSKMRQQNLMLSYLLAITHLPEIGGADDPFSKKQLPANNGRKAYKKERALQKAEAKKARKGNMK